MALNMNDYYAEICRMEDEVENNSGEGQDSAKVVFAEEVVNYMLMKYHGTPYFSRMADFYRNRVPSYFTGSVESAVKLMESMLGSEPEEIISTMKGYCSLCRELFMNYAQDIHDGYLAEGFDSRKFLYYCVHVTRVAMDFLLEGLTDAPKFAMCAILYALQSCELDRGGWEILKEEAENYVSTTKVDCDKSFAAKTVCEVVPTLIQKLRSPRQESSSENDASLDAKEEPDENPPKRSRVASPSDLPSCSKNIKLCTTVTDNPRLLSPIPEGKNLPSTWSWSTDDSSQDKI